MAAGAGLVDYGGKSVMNFTLLVTHAALLLYNATDMAQDLHGWMAGS